jgi:CheY-like chemotaxis protein
MCFEHGGFALKEQKESKGSKILWVKDEKEFYSLIEERLEDQGFEVFETSPPVSRESNLNRFF